MEVVKSKLCFIRWKKGKFNDRYELSFNLMVFRVKVGRSLTYKPAAEIA